MRFGILGPLEARNGATDINISGRRARALLALLLIERGRVVSSDRILDELWPDVPPTSGRTAVQARIAALRRHLGRDRIVTREPGYVIQVGTDELDADRFEDLVEAGRRRLRAGDAPGAEDALREAISLWRGDPLIDAATYGFAQPEIQRLLELRATADEELAEARLRAGRNDELIPELEALVGRYPFRERLRGQLIVALYRAGRQADALTAYQDARRTLAEELGIEPGPELQRLQQAVLTQDPALEAAAAQRDATVSKSLEASDEPPMSAPVTEHRRTVSVLVIATERTPAVDAEVERERREGSMAMTRARVERHGGQMLPPIGDRTAAVFGSPVVHEDDAVRAVRAGLELVEVAGNRVAIATGQVLAPDHGSWDATGEPIAAADRLVRMSATGQVVVDRATERLVRGRAQMDAFELDADAWLVRRAVDISFDVEAPIVGRDIELSQLGHVLGQAERSRSLHLVTVLGPAGIGKSRLAREFSAMARKRDALVLSGQCLAYGEGLTFGPIADMLGQLRSLGELEPALELTEDRPGIERRIRLLEGDDDPEASVQEAFWAFRRLLETLGGKRTVVLIVEDIHWAEPSLHALLEYVVGWTRDAAVVIVCLARSELLERAPSWAGGKGNALTIVLEPLAAEASGQLLESLTAGRMLSAATRAAIADAAEGNPLFLEQLAAHLEDDVFGPGISIPPTIQALLAARVDRLKSAPRAALERAAVVGREFSATAVAALSAPEVRLDIAEILAGLDAAEFIRYSRSVGGEIGYRFRHALLQQAAYESITKRSRGELHARYADWLETAGAWRDPSEADEQIGYHLEQAARHRRAIGLDDEGTADLASRAARRLLAAGRRAFRTGDMSASAGLLGRAAALARAEDGERVASLPDLAFALFEIGRLDDAYGVLDEAVRLAATIEDRRTGLRAVVQRQHVSLYVEPSAAEIPMLIGEARRSARGLAKLGDRLGAARAWRLLSDLLLVEGRSVQAAGSCRRAIEDATAAGSRRERAWALGQLTFCWVWGPTSAQRCRRQIQDILRDAEDDPLVQANVLAFLALADSMVGAEAAAVEHMATARAMTRDLGLDWQVGFHDTVAGETQRRLGAPLEAEALFRSALATFVDQGDRWTAAMTCVDLAGVLLDLDRPDEAREALDQADAIDPGPDLQLQIKRVAFVAKSLAGLGRLDEALELANEAVVIASRTDFAEDHARALEARSQVEYATGRIDDARRSATDAIERYARKGDRASAELARRVLG